MGNWQYRVYSELDPTWHAFGSEKDKQVAIEIIYGYLKARSGIKITSYQSLLDYLEELSYNIPVDLTITFSYDDIEIVALKFQDIIGQCIIDTSTGTHEELSVYISKLVGKDS